MKFAILALIGATQAVKLITKSVHAPHFALA